MFLKLIIFALLSSGFINSMNAATFNEEGTEFWFAFNQNYLNIPAEKEDLRLSITVASRFDTKFTITNYFTNQTTAYSISKDSLIVIYFDNENQITEYEIEIKKSFRLLSEKPVLVWAASEKFQTTDTYTVLPIQMLGMDYNVISYMNSENLASQFTVIATEDSTVITIIPNSFTTGDKMMFMPFGVLLNRGDTYSIAAKSPIIIRDGGPPEDLTGSVIKADKNIAVIASHQCSYVPKGVVACDYLAEQLPPTKFFGKEFYIGNLEKRSNSTYRILALTPETEVRRNSKWLSVINPAFAHEEELGGADIHIETSKPVIIAQYSQGFKKSDSIGDPMMMLVRPVEHYRKSYLIATPVKGDWKHFVNIYIPTKSLDNLKINGKKADKSNFRAIKGTKFSSGSVELTYGLHIIESDQAFGINSYGYSTAEGSYSSYGNM